MFIKEYITRRRLYGGIDDLEPPHCSLAATIFQVRHRNGSGYAPSFGMTQGAFHSRTFLIDPALDWADLSSVSYALCDLSLAAVRSLSESD